MFATIAVVVLGGIAALLGFAATRPDTFRITRSATIAALPEKIFPLIEDLHRWTEWSPWEKLDADLHRTYSGAAKGPGAAYEWAGKKAGAGRMEITESVPSSRIAIDLAFTKPFPSRNRIEFLLTPDGQGTHVEWVMTGSNPFMSKVMSTVVDMDRLVGKDFEAGLANLRTAVE